MSGTAHVSRNAACACGSGRRYKSCCGALADLHDGPEAAFAALMQQALALQHERRLAEACDCYERALAIAPEHPDALHMLGVIALDTGDLARAITLLRQAADAFGWALPAVRHNLGLAILAALGSEPDRALALWSRYEDYRDRRDARREPFRGRVSVVVPSYNHARYVVEAIDSLLRQTRPPDEVIVIDDGSTDDSVDRLRARLASAPATFVLRARANRGAAATINEAVAASSGDYVNVLNSDDRFVPTRLAAMVDAIACTGSEWGFSRVAFIDAAGATIPRGVSPIVDDLAWRVDDAAAHDSVGLAFVSANAAISSGSLFFSRRLFDRVGGFDDLRFNHDWAFCLAASRIAEPVFVPGAQYEYRLHGANTILSSRPEAVAEMQSMFERFHAQAIGTPPVQPFGPSPEVWGDRYVACALAAGHAALLPVAMMRAAAGRALAALDGSAVSA